MPRSRKATVTPTVEQPTSAAAEPTFTVGIVREVTFDAVSTVHLPDRPDRVEAQRSIQARLEVYPHSQTRLEVECVESSTARDGTSFREWKPFAFELSFEDADVLAQLADVMHRVGRHALANGWTEIAEGTEFHAETSPVAPTFIGGAV